MSGGEFHWGCVERGGQHWCPTLLDDHAEVVGEHWGWCRERCKEEVTPCSGSSDYENTSTVSTDSTTNPPSTTEADSSTTPLKEQTTSDHQTDDGFSSSSTVSSDSTTSTQESASVTETTTSVSLVTALDNVSTDLDVPSTVTEEVTTEQDISDLGREFSSDDCIKNDTCQGRCSGGSDFTCWCDDR